MPLDQIANIAEIIAAALVIVSLIYVGLQVRQNTDAIQVSTTQSFTDTLMAFIGNLNQSPNLAALYHRGLSDASSLKGGEFVQFSVYMSQAFFAYQSFHIQWRRGVLEDDLWYSFRSSIVDLLTNPGVREWWQFRRHWFTDEFQQFVEDTVSEEQGHPMYPDLAEA